MKKRLFISMLMVVVLTALTILPTFAANTSASVNNVTANRGETITLTVNLSQGLTVGSGAVEVTYDSAVLELVKGEWNVKNTTLSVFTGNKGAFAYTNGTMISGTIFTATFKVNSNAAFADTTVKMDIQLRDGSNADIALTNNSGTVTVVCGHDYSDWSSTNDAEHSHTCPICNDVETEEHEFDNDCDEKCDACGYTRTITHNYQTTWTSDKSGHWHECSVCGAKKDEGKHNPGAEATETTDQTCTTCGYVIQAALGHTHKPADKWSTDNNYHWHACQTCDGILDKGIHKYDNTCDSICNVCGYERTVTHKYEEKWTCDKDGHWHACSLCGGKDELVGHTWDKGVITKVPTLEENGLKDYTCTECNYVKTVEVELMLVTVAPSETPGPTEPVNPSETPEPTEPVNPSETPEPTEPVNPSETPEPTEPVNPSETPGPTEPVNPSETPGPGTGYIYGDVDVNGQVTAEDALTILKHVVKLTTITDEISLHLADANQDGAIGADDALETLKVVVKLNQQKTCEHY